MTDLITQLYNRLDNELATLRGEILYLTKCNQEMIKQIEEKDNQIKSLSEALRDREKALEILHRSVNRENFKEFLHGYAHSATM